MAYPLPTVSNRGVNSHHKRHKKQLHSFLATFISFSWLYKWRLLNSCIFKNCLATKFHKCLFTCATCVVVPSAPTQEAEEENYWVLAACEQESIFSISLTKILKLMQVTGQHMELTFYILLTYQSEEAPWGEKFHGC